MTADGNAPRTRPKIDKDLIRELAELLAETGLSEIEWSQAGVQVRVARTLSVQGVAPPASLPEAAGEKKDDGGAAAAPSLASHPGAVKSPMVGTIYHAPEPGANPFVQVGDTVKEGQTVLIVEAMKTMNPILAPRAGRVTRILAENQQPVEFDQVLMLIE